MGVSGKPLGAGAEPLWAEYDAREVNWEYSSRDEIYQPIRYLDGTCKELVSEWMAAEVSDEELHALAGAPPGARLSVTGVTGYLACSCVGQATGANREGQKVIVRYATLVRVPLSIRAGGSLPQLLQFCYCTSEPGRTGFGTDVIARMVPICERLGLEGIEGVLAGDGHDDTDSSTGYYVWPSLGFDALLSAWDDRATRPLPEDLQRLPTGEAVETLQDLFGLPGGREWWWKNGSTIIGTFEVADGSRSRRQLALSVERLTQQRGQR